MPTPKERIHSLAHGYLLSSAIFAAAKLGIADLLWEKSEQTVDQLSKALRVDHRSFFRLLRYLVSHGIFTQNANDTFSLNPEAAYLSEKHPESIRHALLVTPGARWNALGAIQEAVTSGKPAFDILYGKSYYEYLSQNPEAEKLFNSHMTTFTQEEDRIIAPLLPIANTVLAIDIGAGEGQFLNEVLNHFSDIYGIVFDLKNVISNIKVCHTRKRWKALEGDFFKEIPQTNADVYILKRVLHNWSDDACLKILKNIHQAMKKTAKLLIIEEIIPENTSQHPSKDTDLFLMALFPGSTRSEKEWRDLTKEACFQITQILTTPSFLSILELKPA